MERHPALQDLARDHFDGLTLAQHVRRSLEGHEMGSTPREAAERFLAAWEEHLAEHFLEEEAVLLPIQGRHVDLAEDEAVGRIIRDHAWFRDTVPELARRLETQEPFEDLLGELGARLHDHARFEDRTWFVTLEEMLTEADLEDVAARSLAYRRAHRDEAAIGPRS
ncbi:MAG: hypothetical protein R3185_05135 [Candidatus Thermoplasmatota archaeon]|nr:hypothetical protein [Candidatus Thermoplasmatota archaeon]